MVKCFATFEGKKNTLTNLPILRANTQSPSDKSIHDVPTAAKYPLSTKDAQI